MQRGRERLRFFDKPFVSWRDDIALFMGPRQAGYSALDVADLTAVEVRSHELMAAHLEFYRREAPGFGAAYLLQSAPQLGVRHSRRLVGVGKVLRAQWPSGEALADEIGVSPSLVAQISQHLDSLRLRWCRASSTGCSPAGGTSRATRIRTLSCAKSRNAGSPGRRPARRPPWPSPELSAPAPGCRGIAGNAEKTRGLPAPGCPRGRVPPEFSLSRKCGDIPHQEVPEEFTRIALICILNVKQR